MAKKVKIDENTSKYTEDWLPIKSINNGYISVAGNLIAGNQIVTGVRVEPRNIFIADQTVQNIAIQGLRNLYNNINYEFWLVSCDRPVDINLYRSELEIMLTNPNTNQEIRKMILEDINKCDLFVGPQINAVDTEFYILFKDSEKNMEAIQKRIHNMITGLAAAGLNSRQITDDDARVLLDSFFNDSKKTEFGTVMSNV